MLSSSHVHFHSTYHLITQYALHENHTQVLLIPHCALKHRTVHSTLEVSVESK